MEYTPISPFKRPMTHVHLQAATGLKTAVKQKPINKWEVLRDLVKAQSRFGVTQRDLTVLQGLLSFFPQDTLDQDEDMVVFPSNKSICERLNGMACSTMRRHLARLVHAGLLVRRDSPNGKRYVRRYGNDRIAFGFDLTPLLLRYEEIAHAAEQTREIEEQAKRLRETVSLMRRDLAAVADFGEGMHPGLGLWDQMRDTAVLVARSLRRKLRIDELEQQRHTLDRLLNTARDLIDGPRNEEMSTNAAETEHHHHNSNKEHIDSEELVEEVVTITDMEKRNEASESDQSLDGPQTLPKLPLNLIVTACPSLKTFYDGDIRHWHQLHAAATHIRPAMGIGLAVWEEAKKFMGPEQASIALAAILERFSEIRSPGAYLRALTKKAASGTFSPGPMIMALLCRTASP